MNPQIKARIHSVGNFKELDPEIIFDFSLIYPELLPTISDKKTRRKFSNRAKSFSSLNLTYTHKYRVYGMDQTALLLFSLYDNSENTIPLLQSFIHQKHHNDDKFSLFFLKEDRLIETKSITATSFVYIINSFKSSNNINLIDLNELFTHHRTIDSWV